MDTNAFLITLCAIAGAVALVAAYISLAPLVGVGSAVLIVLGIVAFAAGLTCYAMK